MIETHLLYMNRYITFNSYTAHLTLGETAGPHFLAAHYHFVPQFTKLTHKFTQKMISLLLSAAEVLYRANTTTPLSEFTKTHHSGNACGAAALLHEHAGSFYFNVSFFFPTLSLSRDLNRASCTSSCNASQGLAASAGCCSNRVSPLESKMH